jgi:hypothetical protein
MSAAKRGRHLLLISGLCLVGLVLTWSGRVDPAQASRDCSLLDDPQARALMSGAFEIGLLRRCGRLPEQPWPIVAPPDVVPAATAPPDDLDIRVNAVDPSTEHTIQSETSWFDRANFQPVIVVEPLSLEASAFPNEVVTQTLWITNAGGASLSFTLHELSRTLVLEIGTTIRPRSDPLVDPEVWAQIQAQEWAEVIIYLRELPDLSPARAVGDWLARGRVVYEQLQETAARSGRELCAWLEGAGAEPRRLLAANAIAATVDAAILEAVASRTEVARIGPNSAVSVPPVLLGQWAATATAVEWNIAQIRADEAWNTFGITGTGVTVAEVGTGVLYTHGALVEQYRGNLGGGLL